MNRLYIKAYFDCSQLNLVKEDTIIVEGVVEKYQSGLVTLKIEKIEIIVKVDCDRVEFEDVYTGSRKSVPP